MKVIIIIVALILVNYTGLSKNSNATTKEESTNKKIIEFLEKGTFKKFKNNIFIKDTMNTKKIMVYVHYKYTSNDWVRVFGTTLYYELVKNNLIRYLLDNNQDTFFISIVYDLKNQNPEALNLCKYPTGFYNYDNYKMYYQFCKYIISDMTPSDFQAYDWAMQILYKNEKDERFNRSFYNFILSASKDEFIDDNERYVFEKLIIWAKSRGEIETTKHFEYFKNSLIEDAEIDY